MGRKKILEKRLQRLMAKKQTLAAKAKESVDVNEVRSINEQLEDINAEIAETQEEIDAIRAEEPDSCAGATGETGETDRETRDQIPASAQLANVEVARSVVGSFTAPAQERNEDPYATMEYRKAFMRYVQTGAPSELIPFSVSQSEKRDAASTEDLGATIPTTVLHEFINEAEKKSYGNLYAKVRKMNVKGGVKIPIGKLQAQFKWITESTVSPRQPGGEIKNYIMFEYNIGEIRIAQTLLSSIVTIDLFEREIVKVMLEAYVREMDYGIINGTGVGQMLGILKDPRIMNDSNLVVEMTASDIGNWTAWRKKFFTTLPIKYRTGEFIFPLQTVDSYLETMADSNNNPIFRQATGLELNADNGGSPNGRFFGRAIELVEPDIIPDFDSASAGDVIGVFWQPNQYAINTNMQFGMKRYWDEEKNEWVNKMLVIVDGKALDVKGFRIIKKK